MKSNHTTTNKKADSGKIHCNECGRECTKVEFHHGLNLCDHLALDTLAVKEARQKKRLQGLGNHPAGSTVPYESLLCPRCRGFMVSELFFDLEINARFEGRRCLSCGNVWDRVIADHQSAEIPKIFAEPSVRTPRPMAVRVRSSQNSGMRQR